MGTDTCTDDSIYESHVMQWDICTDTPPLDANYNILPVHDGLQVRL
jgi:hypothetical protein